MWEIIKECLWRLWATWNKDANKYKGFLLILVNILLGGKRKRTHNKGRDLLTPNQIISDVLIIFFLIMYLTLYFLIVQSPPTPIAWIPGINKDQFRIRGFLATQLLRCNQETIKTWTCCLCCASPVFNLKGNFPDVSVSLVGVFENAGLFPESVSPKIYKLRCSGWIELTHPSLPSFNETFCSVIRWKGEQYLQDLICRYNIMRNLTQIYVPACNGTIRIFICAGERRLKGIFHFLNKYQPNLEGCWG